MSFWKIMGGVGIGVGAVAAAPFTGGGSLLAGATAVTALAGVGTVATAVGAGIAGGVVGACLSDADKKEGQKVGEERATAKYLLREEKLKGALAEALNKLKSDEKQIDLILALVAIGMATANADGQISKEETDELDHFVFGVNQGILPSVVKEQINNLRNNPPSFNTAIEFVKRIDNPSEHKQLFEDVILTVTASDGVEAEEEKAILEAYKRQAF